MIRQWLVDGADEAPDQYHVAVDDGVRARAWDLLVSDGLYRQLAPGTLVHARVSLWRPRHATVHLVEPAAVARQLADPGAPHDPRGPAVPEIQDLDPRAGDMVAAPTCAGGMMPGRRAPATWCRTDGHLMA